MDRNLNFLQCLVCRGVALRKESVDRNHDGMLKYRDAEQSLSARRAWIEIEIPVGWWKMQNVALRKESVDRNITNELLTALKTSRSPQGERG